MRAFLVQHGLAAVNSHHRAGNTYSGSGGNEAKIDYLITSAPAISAIYSCFVLRAEARRMQLIKD